MCEGILLLGFGGLVFWFLYQLTRPDAPATRRERVRHSRGSTSYESPLGLVDDPDDEWIEWAIMDDLDDGEG
ncbi:MAG: hypothetical protein KBH93_01070 [Anaerolineae bacterium]|nr:hypothetical protein [Anaerolineae bacterium]